MTIEWADSRFRLAYVQAGYYPSSWQMTLTDRLKEPDDIWEYIHTYLANTKDVVPGDIGSVLRI